MPYIVYGGVKYIQIRHAVKCKKCLETIVSNSIRDFKYCACGAVAVDGGIFEGNTILGNPSDMESRSMYVANVGNKRVWLPPMELNIR